VFVFRVSGVIQLPGILSLSVDGIPLAIKSLWTESSLPDLAGNIVSLVENTVSLAGSGRKFSLSLSTDLVGARFRSPENLSLSRRIYLAEGTFKCFGI
jgi:hypothetical protein